MSELLRLTTPDQRLEIIESLKLRVGAFVIEVLPCFGRDYLDFNNFRIVDEFAFVLAGIPIWGPELSGRGGTNPYIDIAVREQLYTGPQPESHPVFFPLPGLISFLISRAYGITVEKLIRGGEELFELPTIQVVLGQTQVLIPEPASHVKYFAKDTILNPKYTPETVGDKKLEEWFMKLDLILQAARTVDNLPLIEASSEMIRLAGERWSDQPWAQMDSL